MEIERIHNMVQAHPIRVMIVDDHQLVRDGLKLLLSTFEDIEVVALADDGEKALPLCIRHQPDVILMDIVMPHMDGPTATAQVLAKCPDVNVIALTSFVEDELVQRAIGAGAIGYMLKNVSPEQLVAAIHSAHQGRPTIDSEAAQALIRAQSKPPALGDDLTPRELEVLTLLTEGLTNKEIATRLTLSHGTVRVYVSNILAKLNVNNRTEAATLALQQKIIPQ